MSLLQLLKYFEIYFKLIIYCMLKYRLLWTEEKEKLESIPKSGLKV